MKATKRAGFRSLLVVILGWCALIALIVVWLATEPGPSWVLLALCALIGLVTSVAVFLLKFGRPFSGR